MIGKMKDETAGVAIKEFGRRNNEDKKAKGVKKYCCNNKTQWV